MVDEPELKPCPFCGGNAKLEYSGPTAEQIAHAIGCGQDYDCSWFSQCTECGATGQESQCKTAAISAWNRRAPSPLSPTTTRNLACIKLHLEIAEVSKRTRALMPSIVNFKDALRRLAEVEAALGEYDTAGKG